MQQPQPAVADVKKPVAKNCPEGVYCDPDTKLMWTIADNGTDITWTKAEQYCKSLTLAGLSDWGLPTIDELEKLHDPQNPTYRKIRKPFRLTSYWVWSSTKEGSGSAWGFSFDLGERVVDLMDRHSGGRALCVRQSTGRQPQPPTADVKKPVAKNCPEGVYCDPDTNLMWTIKDNGGDITWQKADQYCKSLTLAGYSGWELPTIDELERLYDPQISSGLKIRKPLRLTTPWLWSSTKQGSGSAWGFLFYTGERIVLLIGGSDYDRALCVRRSGK